MNTKYRLKKNERTEKSNVEIGGNIRSIAKEPGCRACGNPAYPNCKWSCPMFDD